MSGVKALKTGKRIKQSLIELTPCLIVKNRKIMCLRRKKSLVGLETVADPTYKTLFSSFSDF
jgi:hypothetical protein